MRGVERWTVVIPAKAAMQREELSMTQINGG